ncbi:MAG: hypothetical protein CMK07_16160 [Ponticaulis sp.]|nr:hypothetical protein [Ponticaulis sp.]
MIKQIWDAIHFGRFKSQWASNSDMTPDSDLARVGKTLFYETRLESSNGETRLVTEQGGIIGHHMFWISLPVYALLIAGLIMGSVSLFHILLLEAFFIVGFGWLNGIALHKLAQDPGFGVEELSLHRIRKA